MNMMKNMLLLGAYILCTFLIWIIMVVPSLMEHNAKETKKVNHIMPVVMFAGTALLSLLMV